MAYGKNSNSSDAHSPTQARTVILQGCILGRDKAGCSQHTCADAEPSTGRWINITYTSSFQVLTKPLHTSTMQSIKHAQSLLTTPAMHRRLHNLLTGCYQQPPSLQQ
jgi:hypothetical protein